LKGQPLYQILDTLKYLISLGVDITNDSNFSKVLHVAIKTGILERVSFILGFYNNNINILRNELKYVTKKGNLDIVQLIIQSNTNIQNNIDILTDTLYTAVRKNHINIVEYLLTFRIIQNNDIIRHALNLAERNN